MFIISDYSVDRGKKFRINGLATVHQGSEFKKGGFKLITNNTVLLSLGVSESGLCHG
jgi:hypothetical protein